MDIIESKAEMHKWSQAVQKKGKTICLVPTMGFFHQGHLSLMEKGRSLCDYLVVSIFVNPAQFGENEDFDTYPADLDRDIELAEKAGVDILFHPVAADIYPPGYQTCVSLSELPRHLCGQYRPGHFEGVATVVSKLFNIIRPQVAVFGQKDYQQLRVIRQMTQDLDWNIEIVGAEIYREADGLAMSSRNTYLSDAERKTAPCLFKALEMAKSAVQKGQTDTGVLQQQVEKFIESFDHARVEYARFCNPETLEKVDTITGRTLLALAVRVGDTRLIDNTVIVPKQ